MTIPPDPGSGRPDFQPATPPQASAPPPFVGAQPIPPVGPQPPWPQPGMYPGTIPTGFVAAPERPGSATAASVLGIIGGSLGLPFGLLMLFGSSAAFTGSGRIEAEAGVAVMLYSLITLAAAIMLLVTGITYLKGRGHVVLTIGAALQLLLVLFMIVALLYSGPTPPPLVLMMLIGMGLAISTLITTHTSSARVWRRNMRTQGAHGVVL
ncbi:hypothetical protein EII34_15445 [Arachnia propionica]|uniref:Uncharacterized protein n=1 Tax=Arachnia propionica TaxID=1750 RepID=A0A3P1T1J1_9ACTN|nr:hypothetical protein [Arachnia propionica]RRD03108.1 hypothetical protein EII34_15445 [Arachnia propionica]